jgi:hypothetical protein
MKTVLLLMSGGLLFSLVVGLRLTTRSCPNADLLVGEMQKWIAGEDNPGGDVS